ncbi:MAG: hypothetical protein RBS43_07205 [Candidatus Cloacimonas sp.]|jgi:hypothetical protein|nr:hypothetical protein [Candidatus Cloacimonas sp.]
MEAINSATNLRKILFVDEPFAESDTLRGVRSGFLWSIVSAHYDADLLLLKSSIYQEQPVPMHTGFDKLYSLSLGSPNQLYPESYHILAAGQAERFAHTLDSKRYELIVFAGLRCLPLVRIARKILPTCKIIVDIEHNFLPELETAWKANKSLEALPKLWSYSRQHFWDHYLLKPDSICFFASYTDARALRQSHKLKPENTMVFPMPLAEATEPAIQHNEANYILFWGDPLNSANLEAGKYLVSELYPRISKKLVEKNIRILLYGPSALESLCGGRIQYAKPNTSVADSGAAEDNAANILPKLIANAMFILLPLATPDTERRVLRTAMHNKAVACTSITVQDMQLPENCYIGAEHTDELADKILRLVQHPKDIESAALALHQYCQESFNAESIKTKILTQIGTWMEAK